jgi:hypothetical protein
MNGNEADAGRCHSAAALDPTPTSASRDGASATCPATVRISREVKDLDRKLSRQLPHEVVFDGAHLHHPPVPEG